MAVFNGISIPYVYYNGYRITRLKIESNQGTSGGEIEKSTLKALNPYTLSQLNDKRLSEL